MKFDTIIDLKEINVYVQMRQYEEEDSIKNTIKGLVNLIVFLKELSKTEKQILASNIKFDYDILDQLIHILKLPYPRFKYPMNAAHIVMLKKIFHYAQYKIEILNQQGFWSTNVEIMIYHIELEIAESLLNAIGYMN